MKKNKVIDISKTTFLAVLGILSFLIIISVILTYVLPKGQFAVDENGLINYDQYSVIEEATGINIFKGLFAPILVLFSSDGLTILMLSLFLMIISATFQVMSDVDGMKIVVNRLIKRFQKKDKLLIALIVLIFMIFGSFLGLFEETLTLLPIIIMVAVSLGYDSYTGFLMCTVATGFGFASAITNPFTIIMASTIIGISPMNGLFLRIILFVLMYFLLLGFIFWHIKRIKTNPALSPTYEKDQIKKEEISIKIDDSSLQSKRTFKAYVIFLSVLLTLIIVVTSIPALRDYTIVFLILIFLIGGLIAGYISIKNFKEVMKSFVKGLIASLPAIVMVLMASSVKYILVEGQILPTIINYISLAVANQNTLAVAFMLFGIILILEFFISSSTAKAIFVMGILSGVSIGLSKEMMVLLYLFGDGYTNIIFPTSPVLLIALSITGMSYFKWLKKSKWLILSILVIVVLTIIFAVIGGY